MPPTVHVGIDVSRDRHAVCLLDDTGARIGTPVHVRNNRPGAADLIAQVAHAAARYERVQIGLEAPGIYWWHRSRALATAPALAP
jgi:Transposase